MKIFLLGVSMVIFLGQHFKVDFLESSEPDVDQIHGRRCGQDLLPNDLFRLRGCYSWVPPWGTKPPNFEPL